jgi:hypothetical protein
MTAAQIGTVLHSVLRVEAIPSTCARLMADPLMSQPVPADGATADLRVDDPVEGAVLLGIGG